jgi:glycosyltransferase involved in cell wall biosynthesis
MSITPDVSVVIPTLNRPDLVRRAVDSVLTQTNASLEVIVVIDGPDADTRAALALVDDPRLRVVGLTERGGAPNARNVGISHARAPWTAMLDDDDEWLPTKLEVQLAVAKTARLTSPIVASRLLNRTPRAELVMPRRLPEPGEDLSEYLTVRRGLFHGEGFIQTSTIMAPTELLRRVPFTVGLRRCQELDWTLRALSHDDVELLFADEPLVIWYTDEDRDRISLQSPWESQLAWLRESRPLMTPRAYAALMMSVISSMAAPTHSPRLFWTLLRDARRNGTPGALDYIAYLQIWMIPPGLRAGLRDRVLSRRRSTPSEPESALGDHTTAAGHAVRSGA